MCNEKFLGVIKACKAHIKTTKLEDGTKQRTPIHIVKLESSDIDYDSMSKYNPNVSAILLNIQPMPFKSVNFGDQSTLNLQVNFYGEEPDEVESRTVSQEADNESDASFGNVLVTNLSVVVTDNIPTYIFILEIPGFYDGKFLSRALKSKISFSFSEMQKELV